MSKIIMLNDDVQPAREDLTQAYEKPKFNESYAYFIERGREKGLDIVIAHFSDYDKGKIKAGWTFKDGVWRVTGDLPVEFVYDKFPIIDDYSKGVKRDLEEREIGIFNHPNLEKLLKDKHDSYLMFNDLIPFTIPFNKTIEDITLKTDIMQGMDLDADLDKNKVMLKPQYGFGGKGIVYLPDDEGKAIVHKPGGICIVELGYGKKENLKKVLGELSDGEYILQPFLETNGGIPELDLTGRHDLRIIGANGNEKIAYVRKTEGIVSTEKFGSGIDYFDIGQIPKEFRKVFRTVDTNLKGYYPRVFSCDMGRGKSGRVWVYEMNGKPGQVWDPENPIDIEKTKELQEVILDALVQAVSKK